MLVCDGGFCYVLVHWNLSAICQAHFTYACSFFDALSLLPTSACQSSKHQNFVYGIVDLFSVANCQVTNGIILPDYSNDPFHMPVFKRAVGWGRGGGRDVIKI